MANTVVDPEEGTHAGGVEMKSVARAADQTTASQNGHDAKANDGGGSTSAEEDGGPAMAAEGSDANNMNGSGAESGGDADEQKGISMQELIYGASSYHAVVKPVSVTMILAAVAVIYINTDATKAAGEQALDSTYQVFSISDDQSAATSLGLGLVNSLVIVCVIGLMTFVIVLLYKYRCMKILIGYMVLASTMLLGVLGGQMFIVAINKYRLEIDQISFYLTMWNFAVVGTIAIFYQKGMPVYINQAYLVATSVIVAWQLSYFNAWMAWALLIMLALYDLFAVLTPCGPLKALVKLMSKEDSPNMPGLLYEARLPENATRPGRQRKTRNGENGESAPNGRGETQQSNTEGGTDGGANDTRRDDRARENVTDGNVAASDSEADVEAVQQALANAMPRVVDSPAAAEQPPTMPQGIGSTFREHTSEESAVSQNSRSKMQPERMQSERRAATSLSPVQEADRPTATLPLAIAKIYKLPLVSFDPLGDIVDRSSPTAYLQQQFDAVELRTDVQAKLPRNGGRIETTKNKKGEPRYVVYGKNGEVRRTLLVDKRGKVMEVVATDDEDDKEANTIKLGLGDFIFYSVLVSKAAENGFASFVTCFLSILTGLGGTLVLLAVYHKALPALPISIFLAVIMFVLTIYCMEPMIEDMWIGPFYV